MTRAETMRRLAIGLALLLAPALGIPASTTALPIDTADIDADAPRRTGAVAASSLWDSPAAPATVEVKPPQPPEPPPTELERTPSANPLWAIPLATLSNARERPIFSSSRRPPPAAVASVPVVKAPPPPKPPRAERPQLSLVGTIAGDESFGIFIDQTTKAALRLKIGDDYQGWRLRSVQGREVTLERDQQTAILSLPQPGAGTAGLGRGQAEGALTQGSAEALSQLGRPALIDPALLQKRKRDQ
jgi:general secretion pathway protein N